MKKPMQPESSISSQHEYSEDSRDSWPDGAAQRNVTKSVQDEKHMLLMFQPLIHESSKDSENLLPEGTEMRFNVSQHSSDCPIERHKSVEHLCESMDQQWCDISEVIEQTF